jgi:hypothetical protein
MVARDLTQIKKYAKIFNYLFKGRQPFYHHEKVG